jgi:hypothetical protein
VTSSLLWGNLIEFEEPQFQTDRAMNNAAAANNDATYAHLIVFLNIDFESNQA